MEGEKMISYLQALVGLAGLLFIVGCSPVEQQPAAEVAAQTTAPSVDQDV